MNIIVQHSGTEGRCHISHAIAVYQQRQSDLNDDTTSTKLSPSFLASQSIIPKGGELFIPMYVRVCTFT